MTAEVDGELFTLSTGADDYSRYFAVADLACLERLVAERVIDSGALVFLTNVANVWEPPASRRRVLYDAFRIHDGSVLYGALAWGDWGAAGGRPSAVTSTITLRGRYPLAWHDYSTIRPASTGVGAVDATRPDVSGGFRRSCRAHRGVAW
ncbi:MAG: hypothetical protein ACLPZR_23700 [Solirubrobacteraceae bacterium]